MKNLFRYMTYTGFTKNNVKRDLSCIVEKCSAFPMIRSKNKLRSEYISVDIAYGSEKHYKQKTVTSQQKNIWFTECLFSMEIKTKEINIRMPMNVIAVAIFI